MDAVKLSNVSCIPFNHDQNTDSATDEEHPSKIAEIDTNLIKEELKTEEQEDVDNTEEGPKAILMRQSSHDLAIVADLYSLLEDFRTMAHSSKSLLCCQPASYPSVLMCPLCGDYFVGKADRMLNLCKHYETVHPSDALKLILDAMKTYKKLIAHMRKALEFDVWFGDVNYTTVKRNKSFECTECKIN
ncbi:uncharacterized protein LOC117652966 isoform X2 [Thrips palmi]|uniref:Uncharacterized protein LOC117652966 isoform X2 n=1 Tax=Thrips palmi TaxID=161013 RepID=A0A6P9A9B4_THRPL|nr:uncharacterized protein LOC117652966 isoform X2 [Thrips palmi]